MSDARFDDNGSLSPDRRTRAKPVRRRRRRRDVENEDYIAFLRRIIKAAGDRVVVDDPEVFAELVKVADELNATVQKAATGLYEAGHSWAQIGAPIPMTRQGARQRWGIASRGRKAS